MTAITIRPNRLMASAVPIMARMMPVLKSVAEHDAAAEVRTAAHQASAAIS
jgi:hypothetical protein